MPVLGNAKHERFAQGLAKGLTADDAYVSAGYSRNEGNAGRLNRNEQVRARVRELLEASAEKVGITQERVLAELGKIGFSDIRKVFTEDGSAILPMSDWDDDTAGAVASIKVVARPVGKDDDGKTIIEHVHEFKVWDKRAALVDIGKHLGMFKDEKDKPGDIHIHFAPELKGVL